MLRCPRCRTNERKLVRFGVYLCPACGETDPDGVVLAARAATDGAPAAPTFAAPPPPVWVPPGAPVVAPEALGSGPPRILVGTVSVLVLMEFAGIVLSREPCSFVQHGAEIAFLLAVLSGKVWARTMGLFSAMLGIIFAILALALASRVPDARLGAFLRGYGAVALVLQSFWIYVLMRKDVTSYFVKSSRRV